MPSKPLLTAVPRDKFCKVGDQVFRASRHAQPARFSEDRADSTSNEVRRGLRLRDRSVAELHPDLFRLNTSCHPSRARRVEILRNRRCMVGSTLTGRSGTRGRSLASLGSRRVPSREGRTHTTAPEVPSIDRQHSVSRPDAAHSHWIRGSQQELGNLFHPPNTRFIDVTRCQQARAPWVGAWDEPLGNHLE